MEPIKDPPFKRSRTLSPDLERIASNPRGESASWADITPPWLEGVKVGTAMDTIMDLRKQNPTGPLQPPTVDEFVREVSALMGKDLSPKSAAMVRAMATMWIAAAKATLEATTAQIVESQKDYARYVGIDPGFEEGSHTGWMVARGGDLIASGRTSCRAEVTPIFGIAKSDSVRGGVAHGMEHIVEVEISPPASVRMSDAQALRDSWAEDNMERHFRDELDAMGLSGVQVAVTRFSVLAHSGLPGFFVNLHIPGQGAINFQILDLATYTVQRVVRAELLRAATLMGWLPVADNGELLAAMAQGAFPRETFSNQLPEGAGGPKPPRDGIDWTKYTGRGPVAKKGAP